MGLSFRTLSWRFFLGKPDLSAPSALLLLKPTELFSSSSIGVVLVVVLRRRWRGDALALRRREEEEVEETRVERNRKWVVGLTQQLPPRHHRGSTTTIVTSQTSVATSLTHGIKIQSNEYHKESYSYLTFQKPKSIFMFFNLPSSYSVLGKKKGLRGERVDRNWER